MTTFTLSFTIEEMQIIDEALGNLPFKKVAPLIDNINNQIKKANQTDNEQNND